MKASMTEATNLCISAHILPVVNERISDGLADELAVLLQGVERILDCLVNSFLDGATHLLNLVDAATWLRTGTRTRKWN